MTNEARIQPDVKDWTWVLERACPECGFGAEQVPVHRIGEAIRTDAAGWTTALAGPQVGSRPRAGVWSVLEYGCHVRDVHRVMDRRLQLMLDQDQPTFPNWDQDETAVLEHYGDQEPSVVAAELVEAAHVVAARYEAVPVAGWERRGQRSNGSEFTVAGLGRYHLHDVVHHTHDVALASKQATIAAYDESATAYRDGAVPGPARAAAALVLRRFTDLLPSRGRVLEIGSGPGRDATMLENAGFRVRRTDISPGFVELLRSSGHAADLVDPLTDDLSDPLHQGEPYDGVWASACLLHVQRPDLAVVLARLAGATRAGGALHVSVKEGDGEAWSTHGHVAAPRHFTFWREEPLRETLEAAGWAVEVVDRSDGLRSDRWLDIFATRRQP